MRIYNKANAKCAPKLAEPGRQGSAANPDIDGMAEREADIIGQL
jgi:hypothetical protein